MKSAPVYLSLLLQHCTLLLNAQTPLEYVNPFIGTTNAIAPTKWGAEGGTYPGAVAPWGYVQLSPETKTRGGYDYRDSVIYFFSCVNHSSGYPNGAAGSMQVLPLPGNGSGKTASAGRPFRHDKETASPGFYRVQFKDDNSSAEMTAAKRTGMFRFHYPSGGRLKVFLADMGKLEQKSARMVYGQRQHIILAFSSDIIKMEDQDGGVVLTFAPRQSNHSLLVKLAVSTVDHNGSMRNMQAECTGWNFDAFLAANQQVWKNMLSCVEVEDESKQNKTKFYTALYHSFLIPWVISDVDGQYRGTNGKIFKTNGRYQFSKFSPWDTFRSLHPLLSLLVPDIQRDMVRSMLDVYAQTGKLPRGPMTGYHSLPVILDTWQKGIRGFDSSLAWKAMQASLDSLAKEPDYAFYRGNGYVSYDFSESVTKTVEYAYNDWVMARMAYEAGDQAGVMLYKKRAANYRNLLHVSTGFLVPRKGEEYIPEPESRGYKEGDKWVYSYFVPQDPRALVNLMGGDSVFIDKLQGALASDMLLFDNEPVFHIPYLFNYTSQPSLSQAWVRKILRDAFSVAPGGLPGNDDLGSLSSWFVFSAMGFYPVSVGNPVYEIGSPLFRKIRIQLPRNKKLEIQALNHSAANYYVQQLHLDGKERKQLSISHKEIQQGGILRFTMGDQPADHHFSTGDYTGRSATSRPAAIQVQDYRIASNPVPGDSMVGVHFTLRNDGADGVAGLRLYVDNKLLHTYQVQVPADSRVQDSFPVRIYQPGQHRIRLNREAGLVVQVTVPGRQPVRKSVVTGMRLPALVPLGKEQGIVYELQNQSSFNDTARVCVSISGTRLIEEVVLLEPGETKTLRTQWLPSVRGVQELAIGGIVQRVRVVEAATDARILDIAMTGSKPGDIIADLSGLGNDGQYREEDRLMADSTTQTVKYIEFPASASLDKLDEEITVMAWVYPQGQAGMSDIVSKGDFIVFQQSGKTLSFFAGGWGEGTCDVALPADWQNKWHHIAGVCKGRLLKLYIDGVEAGSFTKDHAVNLSCRARWRMGGNEEFPDGRYFNGKINRFKVFAAALSIDEIRQEMANAE